MTTRRSEGRETWNRLLEWDKGNAAAERLAAQILLSERYDSVDPIHPLGGRDEIKDIICAKAGVKFIAACYFPRGQKSFTQIKKKFTSDLQGLRKVEADGMAFITNQELRLSERTTLGLLLPSDKQLDLFHLERISTLLNQPVQYGNRLEFLDIEMNKEEQLAYMISKDQIIQDLTNLVLQINKKDGEPVQTEVISTHKFSSYLHTSFMFNLDELNPYHKCSYCSYGFKIAGRGPGSYAIRIPDPNKITSEYATCPKCGSVERV